MMFSIAFRLLLVDDSFFGALLCISALISTHLCNHVGACLEHVLGAYCRSSQVSPTFAVAYRSDFAFPF